MLGCAGEALDDEITIDPTELADARWVSREQVLEAFGGHGDFQPARPGAIAHFLLSAWVADRLD
jgi:NAD+ diphosphatase